MPPEANDNTPPAETPQWRDLDEYLGSPAFREAMENEFPEDAAEWTDPVSRRNFLTIMGASLALAGAAGCVRPAPQRQIVPYTRQPEQMVPGVPLFFASAVPMAGYATGVLVRSHEGRPVKIEGNPDHPSSLGGTSVHEQASVLDLYDPDRSKEVTKFGAVAGYDEAVRTLRAQLEAQRKKGNGAGLRILTGAVTSPTLADAIGRLIGGAEKKGDPDLSAAKWVQYEPCGQDNVREGVTRAFGRDLSVVYDFAKADVILSLDADFLGSGPGHVRYCRDFSARRRVRQAIPAGQEKDYVKAEQMSRLYVVECMPTQTGSVADHRLALPAGQIDGFARALAAKLGVASVPGGGVLSDLAQKWLEPLAKDLTRTRTKCVVVVGDHQPPHVHALAHAINAKLENIGQTVALRPPVEARPAGRVDSFAQLLKDMAEKKVEALVILGGTNPAFTAAADQDFAGALKNVPFKFHLGVQLDETAALCEWHVNEAHFLETWGDGRGHDGTVAIQQPLIAPLYEGKSVIELLADVVQAPGVPRGGREIVKAFWRRQFGDAANTTRPATWGTEFEAFWQETVRSGVIQDPRRAAVIVPLAANWSSDVPPPTAPSASDFEINFRADPTLFDGRYANNGWLQELPKPVTKITWDNAAFVGPKTADTLKIDKKFKWTAGEHGRSEVSVVTLEYKGRKVTAPVWILPGHPENAVTVHLGHGRKRAGRVASQDNALNTDGEQVRGFNAYALRTADAPSFSTGLKVSLTGNTYFLACTQANWVMTQHDPISGKTLDRKPARRQDIEDYKKNPEYAKVPPVGGGETDAINHNVPGSTGHGHDHTGHKHAEDEHGGEDKRLIALTMYKPNDALYPEQKADHVRKWGMAIDLSACTGCNACVVACQSENNTPVVGKHEVTRGHEMYWLRIDRYYEGDLYSPDVQTYFQPVPCQQCEKAPCEVVCPVGATVHSADGLNDMVYNRCVGTRYCSNNCPYKVRRFNFLTFQDWATASIKLGRNPDVTVRSRGVMEKCTYCVQRIRYAEIVAEREHRSIRDGEVITACAAACPSRAISFGDLNDANSTVGKWKAEPQNYGLLAELNTMPRTSYLATLRNPNPEMK